MPATPETRTDDDVLATTDIALLLRHGLVRQPLRTALFGDGVIAAAVTLDRLATVPRSVAYVARIVRSGGLRYTAALREPLPSPEASARLREWLEAAADAAGDDAEAETRAARWLEAVAEVLGLRHDARRRHGRSGRSG
ncbi:hypothetical protein ACIPRD_22865 [Streptomyces sp. NPDC090108]|uniref:hypothetical protein n=1 Tax=Streptomyces sp. NPDC090108 TaxID=3365947 RepID=UPI003802230C